MSDSDEWPRSGAGRAGESPSSEDEMLRCAGQMLGEGRALVQDYLDLLAVEGQLAGRSLVLMLALAICLALVLVAAWIFLTLSGAMWLVQREWLTAAQALLAGAGAHVLAALAIGLWVRRLSGNLVFAGFREAIERDEPDGTPEDRT